ncbi:unnamed protein product [Sympodiomycopsis kandeliae]
MSSLLQSILSSKLSNSTLEDKDSSEHPHPHHDDWEEVNTSDEELVGIQSVPGTVPGSPLEISRPNTPGTSSKTKSSLSQDRPIRVKAVKSKTDPLRSLPKELTQRIFLSLGLRELMALSVVNRRYRRSATLNYCWYRLCTRENDLETVATNSSVFGNTIGTQSSLASSGGYTNSNSNLSSSTTAKWTRRESKTDWKKQYIKRKQQEEKDRLRSEGLFESFSNTVSGSNTPSRSQRLQDAGVKTNSDIKQDQWNNEASEAEKGYTKNELRAYYKETGGSKGGKAKGLKPKSGKGANRAGVDDLWE